MGNKSISQLSVAENAVSSDLFLISQQDPQYGYYISKQMSLSSLESKLSSDVANDYVERINNLAIEMHRDYSPKSETYDKSDIDERLKQVKNDTSSTIGDTIKDYAPLSSIYTRNLLSTAKELDEEFSSLPLKYPLIDRDEDGMAEALGLKNFVSKTSIETSVTESTINIPASKVVYDLKELAEDNQRKVNQKSTVKYSPNVQINEGNKIGTINIDGVDKDLYSGLPIVNDSLGIYSGRVGCNENYMATQNWVKDYVGSDLSKVKTPMLDVPLLTPMFFDYKLPSTNLQWVCANGSWQSGKTYTVLFNHLVDDLTGSSSKSEQIEGVTIQYHLAADGHKICDAAQKSNADSIYSKTGISWYYILDQANQQFILPRTKFSFSGLRDTVGNYISPGLPTHDHSGTFSGSGSAYGATSHSGVSTFHMGFNGYCVTGIRYGNNSVSVNGSITVNNASDGIYGKSTTVQPPSTQMYLYFASGFTKDYLQRDEIDENEIWTFHYVDEAGQSKQAIKHVIIKA